MDENRQTFRQKKRHPYRLNRRQRAYLPVKRAADLILSALSILLLALPMGILAALILLDSGRPVLFRQKRVGKNGTYFEILKFRTMRTDTPKNVPTHLLDDPDRYITKVGRVLRKTSLDELPQIFNIFKGDMSFIGPRPALWNQYDLIAEREKYGVNALVPGLTGWAQTHGRDELKIREKARLDRYYLRHLGPAIDISCFFLTLETVITKDGVKEGRQISPGS